MKEEEIIHENKHFKIFRNKSHYLKYHGNKKGIEGSSVLIFNKEKTKIFLVNIYRDAVKRNSWEAPRGGAENNESYLECAKREGEEETGLVLSDLKLLGTIAPDTGTMSSCGEVYEAIADYKEIPKEIDTDDLINSSRWFDIDEVLKMIKNDEIVCSITISSIMKYFILNKKIL